MTKDNVLAIVVPCYNEQDAFPFSAKSLTDVLCRLIKSQKVSPKSYILFVDDGSKDNTWSLIEAEAKINPVVQGLKLSGNVGHQNALLAGLITANKTSDMTVSIDADLQDDVNVIEQMVDKYLLEGCEVVYGVRSKRETDSFFKRTTAQGFYKIMNFMGTKSVYNHADFRLLSNRVLKALESYKEQHGNSWFQTSYVGRR